MAMQGIDLKGGGSIYCINEQQLHTAYDLTQENPESAPKLQAAIEELEGKLTRNELAALAFVLIDRLLEDRPA